MPARYTAKEQNAVLDLFLDGVDDVNLEALREAVRELRKDRVRIDRLEALARHRGEIQLDVRWKIGQTLREIMDSKL
jgi:hypothetical protein